MKQLHSTSLRDFATAKWLKTLTEPIEIVTGQFREPVAVLVPMHIWDLWQHILHIPGDPDYRQLIEELSALGRQQ